MSRFNRKSFRLIYVALCLNLLLAMQAALVADARATSIADLSKPSTRFESVLGVYEDNRSRGIANYITVDLPLVAYALLRQKSIAYAEENKVFPFFREFLQNLGTALSQRNSNVTQIDEQSGSDQILAANRQFILVLQSLLDGEPSAELSSAYQAEYERVMAAQGVEESPVWGRQIDYTQFKPRGSYTRDENTERFFRSVRYAGAQWFAIQPSKATGLTAEEVEQQTAQLIQLVSTIENDEVLKALRQDLDQALEWQFGAAEDLTDSDVMAGLENVRDKRDASTAAKALFDYAVENQRHPKIIDAVVDQSQLEPGTTLAQVVTGWRLLPARFSVVAGFQQAMLASDTGLYTGDPDSLPFGLGLVAGQAKKSYPLGAEWLAVLGSDWAYNSLKAAQEMAFEGYEEALTEYRAQLNGLTGAELLHAEIIRAGFQDSQSDAQRLETLLAFDTWHRFLNVLYTKQSYTPGSKGFRGASTRAGIADVEQATPLYLMLGFAAREQARYTGMSEWTDFSGIADTLVSLSVKRSNQASLTAVEQKFLNELDERLLSLTGVRDLPVVVDIHSNPNENRVVQMGTGHPELAHQYDGNELSSRGSRMSFEEFKQPMDARLTREQWLDELWKESRP